MPANANVGHDRDSQRVPKWLWIVGFVLLPGCLRVLGLDGFPGVIADEGLWTNSSKNFVAYGDWFMDGRTHALLSPVFHGLTVLIYSLSEPSIANARTVSALASTGSVPLLYGLVRRSTGDIGLAATAAIIFGMSSLYVYTGRQAMIEATQIFFALLAAWFVARRDRTGALLGGLAFGLALLAKINVAILGPILVLFILPVDRPLRALRERKTWLLGAGFAIASLGLAAAVNFVLYSIEPELFRRAYLFELRGDHFAPESAPLLRFGRFALNPIYAARNVLELIREAPMQMILCMFGAVTALANRKALPLAWWAWLIGAAGFVLIQNYQPVRYFLIAAPAFALFAAVGLMGWGEGHTPTRGRLWQPAQSAALALFVAFNLASIVMNVFANPDTRLRTIRDWVHSETSPEERIIAAGFFCTDLVNPSYAHYYLGSSDIDELATNVERLDIGYVIHDDREWSQAAREELAKRYPIVKEWNFATVFDTRSSKTRLQPVGARSGANARAKTAVAPPPTILQLDRKPTNPKDPAP